MGCDPTGGACDGGSGGGGGASGQPVVHSTVPAFGPGSGQTTTPSSGFNPSSPGHPDLSGGVTPAFSQICGSTNQLVPYNQNYTDPLGPNASGQMAPGGGPEMRAGIYSTLQSMFPGLAANTNDSVSALRTAASDPGYASEADLARRELNGDFLHGSPELDNAVANMRAASDRSAADSSANIRSNYARSGMSFGTPAQEAQMSNEALGRANANATEGQMRLSNYQTERQNQNSAGTMLDQATGSPVNYLSQVNAAELSPLSAMSQIISGLSGGGSTSYQPQDIVHTPGYSEQLTEGIGGL